VNADQLFINLSYRLRNFPETIVLWELLRTQADERVCRTTATRLSADRLDKTIDAKAVQRAFKTLEKKGLIEVRIQRNTATSITVNREAVFQLLNTELDGYFLPGQGKEHDLPFLRSWNERQQPEPSGAIAVPTETASQPSQPVPN
jgi:hypothetical protein